MLTSKLPQLIDREISRNLGDIFKEDEHWDKLKRLLRLRPDTKMDINDIVKYNYYSHYDAYNHKDQNLYSRNYLSLINTKEMLDRVFSKEPQNLID